MAQRERKIRMREKTIENFLRRFKEIMKIFGKRWEHNSLLIKPDCTIIMIK
jgi:hypothetical protein